MEIYNYIIGKEEVEMKNLKTLYNSNIDINITGVSIHSKNTKKGDLYIARKGLNSDGNLFVQEAIDHGAVAVVSDRNLDIDIPLIKVLDINSAVSEIIEWYYGSFNDCFHVIGVTGTTGKTSVCYYLEQLLNQFDYTSLMCTNCVKCNGSNQTKPSLAHTMYPINAIYQNLLKFREKESKNVVLEVTSEGLKQNRTGNLMFDIGVLTNIDIAHIDAHGNMEDYIESKLKMFNKIKKNGVAILNKDSKYFDRFEKTCNCSVYTYGKTNDCDLQFFDVNYSMEGTSFKIKYKNHIYFLKTHLIGTGNVYNICSVILVALKLGYNIKDVIPKVENLCIKGRLEIIKHKNRNYVIDFAVTSYALRTNLEFLNTIKKNKIICVISKLEGKDSNEYYEFGKIANQLCDTVIVTTDRNKTGKSEAIKYISSQLKSIFYKIVLNREDAIKYAIDLSDGDDIIYIVGSEYFFKNENEEAINPYEIIEKYSNE